MKITIPYFLSVRIIKFAPPPVWDGFSLPEICCSLGMSFIVETWWVFFLKIFKIPRWGTPYNGAYGEAVTFLISDCFPSSYSYNKTNLRLLRAWFLWPLNRGEKNRKTLVGTAKRWPRSLNRGLISHSFLQLFRGIDYWPLNGGWLINRWPLNGGLTVYRVGW